MVIVIFFSLTVAVAEAEAISKNIQAEEWMLQKKYANALHLYCAAIELCPNKENFYVNRSRCYLQMNELQKAQNDARKAIELNPMCLKGHLTLIKCYIAIGDLTDAETTLQTVKNMYPNEEEINDMLTNVTQIKDNYENYMLKFDAKKYEEALEYAEKCTEMIPNCIKYKYAQIQSLNSLQRFPEVIEIADEILKIKSTDDDALYYKTAAQCYQKYVEEALPLIKVLKKQIPDHEKTKKLFENINAMCKNILILNTKIQEKNYVEAHAMINKTIKLDENFLKTNKKLRLTDINEIIGRELKNDDLLWSGVLNCTEYIRVYGFNLNIFKRKIEFLMLSEEYEDAIEELKVLCTKENNPQNLKQLQNAENLLKDQLESEHKILKISSEASQTEIKDAAMKLKKRYHPDKNINVSAERKKQLEKRLMLVRRAEEILLKKNK